MALRLFNTLSGKVEEFRPLVNNEVRMYACGPTVYDYGHIGNFRTFVAVDILRRYLRQSGYKLHQVMNITDVDDKIIRNSAQAGVTVQQYTAKYQKAFLEDAAALHIEQPQIVRATENIPRHAARGLPVALGPCDAALLSERNLRAHDCFRPALCLSGGRALAPDRIRG